MVGSVVGAWVVGGGVAVPFNYVGNCDTGVEKSNDAWFTFWVIDEVRFHLRRDTHYDLRIQKVSNKEIIE